MSEIFVFGTMWFWILTVVVMLIIGWVSDFETGGEKEGVLFFALYLLLLHFGGNNLIDLFKNHYLLLLVGFLSYFAIGMIWGVIKWFLYCQSKKHELIESVREFCVNHEFTFSVPFSPEVWDQYLKKIRLPIVDLEPQKIWQHKARFMRWVAFWPTNLLVTIFNDFFRNICQHIYNSMARKLQNIADRVHRGVVPKK